MSFSIEVKEEVLQQEFNKEQALAFANGIIFSSSEIIQDNIIIKLNNNKISSEIKEIFQQLNIRTFRHKQNKNWILLNSRSINLPQSIKQPGYYFAGVFVGGGSISDPQTTSYHLEIQFYYRDNAEKVIDFLSKYKFNFMLIQRRKKWVIYLKKSDLISDFLKAIQATKSFMLFEDTRIQRDFRNHLNRYSNLDTHNQEKLSKASLFHLKNYEYVINNSLIDQFRAEELTFFDLKKENPFSSLAELALMLEKKGIKKTKSGLNHWLIKLRKIAEM